MNADDWYVISGTWAFATDHWIAGIVFMVLAFVAAYRKVNS